MRKPIIAGNWKMNMTSMEAIKFVQDLSHNLDNDYDVEILICPPFTAIRSLSTVIDIDQLNISLGAQNMHWEQSGAYTGEISAGMLKDLTVEYVIIGHSERRQYFFETDETVNKKINAALSHGIKPIMCVGESLLERESGQTNDRIISQVTNGLQGIPGLQINPLVIAYEPIWAIGTGKSATPHDANVVCSLIRNTIGELYGEDVAGKMRILYGGSVSPGNISDLMLQPDIDGGLVGGASLEPDSYWALIKATAELYSKSI